MKRTSRKPRTVKSIGMYIGGIDLRIKSPMGGDERQQPVDALPDVRIDEGPQIRPRLAFPVLFEKTVFYKRLADFLELDPNDCFWLSTSPRWSRWLLAEGVPAENILQISRLESAVKFSAQRIASRAAAVESGASLSLTQVASSDRVLSGWKYEAAQRYLGQALDKIWSFLEDHRIEVVFGEMTTHLEFLAAAIAKTQGRLYFVPESLRSPSGRFAFYRWTSFRDYYRFRRPVHKDAHATTKEAVDALVHKQQKPHYWFEVPRAQRLNTTFVRHSIFRLRESLKESEENALVWSLRDRLTRNRKYLSPFRSFFLRKSNFFEQPVAGERFVLFPLHRQPEASVDAAAPKWQNQVETVRQLALELPFGVRLYVKEHFSALGERPMGVLRAIKRIPGVRLIDPRVDTYHLIKQAAMVVTIAGTASLEARILGTPAVTLAPIFFNEIPSIPCVNAGAPIRARLQHARRGPPGLPDPADFAAYEDLIANSFEGVVSDPINAPYCVEGPNLAKVAFAFMALFRDLRQDTSIASSGPTAAAG